MSQAARYRTTGRELLDKAFAALAQDDLLQASEKGWGAAAQAVKAVADSRGWTHNGHRYLFEVVGRIVQEIGDARPRELFLTANALHTNFYENWLTREDVETGLQSVREFLDQLEPLQTS